jgi:EF hand
MNSPPSPRALLIAGLLAPGLLLAACRSTESSPRAEVLPMDLTGEFDSTLAYLLARHDADGDGQITRDEYPRAEVAFGRLDRNDDGVISDGDWQRRSRDGRGAGGGSGLDRMRTMRATGVVAMYFQRDDPGTLTTEELSAAAGEYDTDHDGKISAGEFTCAFESRKVELPGNMGRMMARMASTNPWDAMTAAIDGDEDGAVALAELATFFHEADGDGDGVWTFDPPAKPSEATARPARPQAPAVGVVAPDFTLASPDGGDPITLSDFAGKKPVALIFGSYT